VTGRRKCIGCEKKGHIARNYSHKKDGGQDGSRKKKEAFCLYVDASVTENNWIADSAASYHMTPRREWFITFELYVVQVMNSNQVPSADSGTILIRALVDGEWSEHRLVNVLHVLSFDRNFISTPTVVERSCQMIGDAESIKFEKNGRVVLAAGKQDRVFMLFIETRNRVSCRAARAGSFRDWHERLGHAHVNAIRTIARTAAIEGLQVDGDEENFFCELCVVIRRIQNVSGSSTRRQVNSSTRTCSADSRRVRWTMHSISSSSRMT